MAVFIFHTMDKMGSFTSLFRFTGGLAKIWSRKIAGTVEEHSGRQLHQNLIPLSGTRMPAASPERSIRELKQTGRADREIV
jgi:hypothetical protein